MSDRSEILPLALLAALTLGLSLLLSPGGKINGGNVDDDDSRICVEDNMGQVAPRCAVHECAHVSPANGNCTCLHH